MTTPLPPLEDLQALYEKATPGPWIVRPETDGRYPSVVLGPDGNTVACTGYGFNLGRYEANAGLIVSAVNALPSLLTHLATLTDRAQAAEGECARLRDALETAHSELREAADKFCVFGNNAPVKPDRLAEDGAHMRALSDRMATSACSVAATLARPASGPGEAVAWQYRKIGSDHQWAHWSYGSAAPAGYETRPLFAAPPAAGSQEG